MSMRAWRGRGYTVWRAVRASRCINSIATHAPTPHRPSYSYCSLRTTTAPRRRLTSHLSTIQLTCLNPLLNSSVRPSVRPPVWTVATAAFKQPASQRINTWRLPHIGFQQSVLFICYITLIPIHTVTMSLAPTMFSRITPKTQNACHRFSSKRIQNTRPTISSSAIAARIRLQV